VPSGPAALLFFDDVAANVEAARTVGIRAFQVSGITGLRPCLTSLGLEHDPTST